MGNNVHAARREFYLNADFDRTLRGVPSCLDENYHSYIHEMSQHFLFAAEPGESVLLHRSLPEDFLDYLAGKRLEMPRLIVHPAFTPSSRFTPFGWNAHTDRLNRRYAGPAPHPPLEAVREANSRVFSQAWERLEGSVEPVGIFGSIAELEEHIRAHPGVAGWVAKGNHGHAGTANRRLSAAPLEEAERRDLALLFREDAWVALEPWHDRLIDMSANFQVDPDGSIRDFRGHELVNSRIGHFLGAKIAPSGQPPEPWRDGLEDAAARLGKALAGIGYFGPVSMDAYARVTPGGPVLRPCVDINARLSMALPAHSLARRLPGRHLLWQWVNPRKLSLPRGYAGLREALGPADFDPEARRGILAVSPLGDQATETGDGQDGGDARDSGKAGKGRLRLAKRVAFLLCARDESDLQDLQKAFQDALGTAR